MAATSSVTVALRIKPAAPDDKAENCCLEVAESLDGQKALVTVKGKGGSLSEFNFDTVFMDSAASGRSQQASSAVLPNTQRDVFDRVAKPLCRAVLRGMHASILAYGQTGSGKTYTMLGPLDSERQRDGEQLGLVPRCLNYLFKRLPRPPPSAGSAEQLFQQHEGDGDAEQVEEEGDEGRVLSWKMEVQFVEIYQERLFDLLQFPVAQQSSFSQQAFASGGGGSISNSNNGNNSVGLAVRYDKHGKGAHVAGAVRKEVFCLDDALEAFRSGLRVRRTSETKLNTSSSRSHAMFSVFLTQTKTEPAVGDDVKSIVNAQLHLVDLAGSERQKDTQAVGERLREAGKINSSLSILSQVVRELAESGGNGGHIPYRDSKLTFLLMNSLGGSGKAAVIATLNQQQQHAMETRSTLGFAALSKSVRLRPVANQMLALSNERVLALVRERAELAAELKRLQALNCRIGDRTVEEVKPSPRTSVKSSEDLFQALIYATEAAEVAKAQLRAVLRFKSATCVRQASSEESTAENQTEVLSVSNEDEKPQQRLLQLLLRHSMYSPQLLLQLQEDGFTGEKEGEVNHFLRLQAVLVRLLELQPPTGQSSHAAVLPSHARTLGSTSGTVAVALAAAFEKALSMLKTDCLHSNKGLDSLRQETMGEEPPPDGTVAFNGDETMNHSDASCSKLETASASKHKKDAAEEDFDNAEELDNARLLWEPQLLAAAELLGTLADAALVNDATRQASVGAARDEGPGVIYSDAIDEALQRLATLRGFVTLQKKDDSGRPCREHQEEDASVDLPSGESEPVESQQRNSQCCEEQNQDSRSSTLASRGMSSTDAPEEAAAFPLSPRFAGGPILASNCGTGAASPPRHSTVSATSDLNSVVTMPAAGESGNAAVEGLDAEDTKNSEPDYEQLKELLEQERRQNQVLKGKIAELELKHQSCPPPCQHHNSQDKNEEHRMIGLPFLLPLSAICDGQQIYGGQLTFCVHPNPGDPLATEDKSYNGPCYISIWEESEENEERKTSSLIDSVPFSLLRKVSRVRDNDKNRGFSATSSFEQASNGVAQEGPHSEQQQASQVSNSLGYTRFLYRLYFRQPVTISRKGSSDTGAGKSSKISWVTVAIHGDMVRQWNISSTEDCDKLILRAMRRGAGKHRQDCCSVRHHKR
ncbi:hypothetical protein Efla_003108 [Eimeria flavescens]